MYAIDPFTLKVLMVSSVIGWCACALLIIGLYFFYKYASGHIEETRKILHAYQKEVKAYMDENPARHRRDWDYSARTINGHHLHKLEVD